MIINCKEKLNPLEQIYCRVAEAEWFCGRIKPRVIERWNDRKKIIDFGGNFHVRY